MKYQQLKISQDHLQDLPKHLWLKSLEELGIGRPSTYAPTIKTIQDRGYVENKDLDGKTRAITQLILIENELKEVSLNENFGADRKKFFLQLLEK